MNNIVRGSLFFISGAAIASFITYKVVEKKFKKIADEEIESVKSTYRRKLKKLETKKNETPLAPIYPIDEKSLKDETDKPWPKQNPYSSLVNDLGYGKNKEGDDMPIDTNIEVIPPEDFGEYGYKCESLTYYADKILTFDDNRVITDTAKYVGHNALNTFGEYEDDSVFVRNHTMKTDFEILLDSRSYANAVVRYDD